MRGNKQRRSPRTATRRHRIPTEQPGPDALRAVSLPRTSRDHCLDGVFGQRNQLSRERDRDVLEQSVGRRSNPANSSRRTERRQSSDPISKPPPRKSDRPSHRPISSNYSLTLQSLTCTQKGEIDQLRNRDHQSPRSPLGKIGETVRTAATPGHVRSVLIQR